MAGTKKRFGIIKAIAIAAVVLIAAIIAIPFVFDVNQFRPEFESRLTRALGREVEIGNLELSLLSGSVEADSISIADDPAFGRSPFLHAKSLRIGIELRPLIFSKAIHIKGISLDKPAITFIRSPSGKWNFSRFGSSVKKEESIKGPGNLPGTDISIKQVKITGGRINMIVEPRKSSVYEDVNILVDNPSLTSAFPFALTASLPGRGKLELEGKVGPPNLKDMMLIPLAADLKVTYFDLVASGFVAAGSGLSGLIDFGGTVNSDGKKVRSTGRASAGRLQLVKNGSPAGGPVFLDYAVEHDLQQQNGALRDAKVGFGKAVARLNGAYDNRGTSLELKMRLHGKGMPLQDLETLLPAFGVTLPKGASLEGGTLNVDLATEGPVERMVTTGTVEVTRTRLTGFDFAGKMAALAALAGLKPSAATDIERFFSEVRLTREGTQVNRLELIVPAIGNLFGNGKVGIDQSLDFKMRAVLKPSGGFAGDLVRITGSGGLVVPFFVRGTATDPEFFPDVEGAAGSLLGSATRGAGAEKDHSDPTAGIGTILRDLFEKKK
jgi:AsmA protein